jgi:hypothetical protein
MPEQAPPTWFFSSDFPPYVLVNSYSSAAFPKTLSLAEAPYKLCRRFIIATTLSSRIHEKKQ